MDCEIRDKTVTEEGISKFAFERLEAAHERANKRLWLIIIILLVTLAATIAGAIINTNVINDKWAKILSEYEFETYEVDLSSEGDSDAVYNYIGKDGDIYNAGADSSKKADHKKETELSG